MERFTIRNSEGIAVYKHPYMCERCGEDLWRLPDLGDGSPTEKLAAYEDLQDRLDRQFNGHVSMAMIIGAIIEYDKQFGRDEALADAMLITSENVHKYREWKSLEGQGRLLKLPVPIGGRVYEKDSPMYPNSVIGYRIGRMTGEDEEDHEDYGYDDGECHIEYARSGMESSAPVREIGESIFLTQEEAEQASKEGVGREINVADVDDYVC